MIDIDCMCSKKEVDETVLLLSPVPTGAEERDSKRTRLSSATVSRLTRQKANRRSRQLDW